MLMSKFFLVVLNNCMFRFALSKYYFRIAEDGIFVMDRFTGEFVHHFLLSDVIGISFFDGDSESSNVERGDF